MGIVGLASLPRIEVMGDRLDARDLPRRSKI
jgi:hypothetical protein